MQELLPQLDPDYCRSALLLVVRAELERLRQERSTCADVKRPSKLRSAFIRGQRIRFKGSDGGSEVADRVLQYDVRSRFGVLPRTKPVTTMELASYVRSARSMRKDALCPSRGKSRLDYPPAGTVASVDHDQ
jgi:hypothetical protein